MKNYPKIYQADELVSVCSEDSPYSALRECYGKKYPIRPLGQPFFRNRLKAAWLVFTGRADAIIWPFNEY